MYKRIFFTLFFIVMTEEYIFAQQGSDDQKIIPVVGIVSKLKALYALDKELKSTWSYQTLTVAKATYESIHQQSIFTYGGFLQTLGSVLTWHNSPQILITVGRIVLPNRLYTPFERTITHAFEAAHIYTIFKNPLQQPFGYACGFVGVYLVMNVLDRFDAGNSQRELQGLTYFCCREAGWAYYDTHSEQVFAFLQKMSLPFLRTSFAGEDSLKTDPQAFLIQKRKEVERMDDNVNVHTQEGKVTNKLITKCEDPKLKAAALSEFNSTIVPAFFSGYRQAMMEGKKFHFFFGEDHMSCNCYWQERELFKWARSFGINTLLVELSEAQFVQMQKVSKWLKTLTMSEESLAVMASDAKFHHAQQLQMTIVPIDTNRPLANPLWDTDSIWYFSCMDAFIKGQITIANYTLTRCKTIDFTACPQFEAREEAMVSRAKATPGFSIGVVGSGHLGALHNGLKGSKNALIYFANCALPTASRTPQKTNNRRIDLERIYVFNKVFGDGCGERYQRSGQFNEFYENSPEVIQSQLEKDVRWDRLPR